ncbi:MAG: acyltransferase family protein [Termitinemataceae bacterium]|nr:MAG: acyltransferase family protein [Termitinemataceae bacterium]
MQTRIMENRIPWIDYAKAIGIFLVIFSQNKQLYSFYGLNISYAIYTFAIPLFFFVSGFLQKERSFKKNLLHIIFTLLVPYILLCILSFLIFYAAISVFEKSYVWNIKSIILGSVIGNPPGVSHYDVINPKLWFLFALFWIKLLHNLYEKIFVRSKALYIVLSFIPVVIVLILRKQDTNINLPFCINQAMLCMPFFNLGFLLRNHIMILNKLLTFNNKKASSVLIFIMFFLILYLAVINGGVDSSLTIWGKYLILYYINAIIGITFILLISICMPTYSNGSVPKIIKSISSNTLLIFALSEPLIKLMETYIPKYNQYWHLMITTPITFAEIALLLCAAIIINRYAPLVGGKWRKL